MRTNLPIIITAALGGFASLTHAVIGVISPGEAKRLIENPNTAKRPIVFDTRGSYPNVRLYEGACKEYVWLKDKSLPAESGGGPAGK